MSGMTSAHWMAGGRNEIVWNAKYVPSSESLRPLMRPSRVHLQPKSNGNSRPLALVVSATAP